MATLILIFSNGKKSLKIMNFSLFKNLCGKYRQVVKKSPKEDFSFLFQPFPSLQKNAIAK
jgi:hypothetical protein